MDDSLKHIGIIERSGRYPWGSGENPYQRSKNFSAYVSELRKEGLSDTDIAKGMGMSSTTFRKINSINNAEKRAGDAATVLKLKEKGYSNIAIGKKYGWNESYVRLLLNPILKDRSEAVKNTANMLKEAIEKKQYIDVGVGVERNLGITRTKLDTAIALLQQEGYPVMYSKTKQLGTGKNTSLKFLGPKDTWYPEFGASEKGIQQIIDTSKDSGKTWLNMQYPESLSSKRIQVRYAEDGGSEKDGVIELRKGVPDISLGPNSRYAQVRIAVDGTHYLKGMAIYADDLPKGVDVIFNTNKHKDTPKMKVFKEMKKDILTGEIDKDNPFGATIKANGQRMYKDKEGKEYLSVINKVNDEGSWNSWSDNMSSQMLSKQPPQLAKKQLDLAYQIKKEAYDEISQLTNPVIKSRLLISFADGLDSAAVELKAAPLPRQKNHVILPLSTLKETEVYAPSYRNGEKVVLIRHPHGGTFEIPELRVNNKNPDAIRLFGQTKDAIAIHPKVAERLSGADFDGDSVVVIPNPKGVDIQTSPALKSLKGFDPKERYPAYEGMPEINPKSNWKTRQMGDISNLITDMTIKGADFNKIARAVKHSMVIIDAEKHNLNYKQSFIDNGIAALKKEYQGKTNAGASTLISRASSDIRVPTRKQEKIDPLTGKKTWVDKNETYINKQGKEVMVKMKSKKMAEVDDAFELSSGSLIETVYANHANKLKAFANQARKEAVNAPKHVYSPSARVAYQKEVDSLKAKLNVALKHSPYERQALLIANKVVAAKKESNPNMDAADLKKVGFQAMAAARSRFGSKPSVDISPKEWEAIQAGAVTTNTLTEIIKHTNLDKLKQLATPRTTLELTPAKQAKIKQLLANGYTQAEVAESVGVSVSSVLKVME